MSESLTRRRFVVTSAAAAASLRSLAQTPAARGRIVVHAEQPLATMPANFIGLSYETQQLSDPEFFSPANAGLIAEFKALAPHGVLRLGGNTSDYGYWKPTATSLAPPRPKREYKAGDPPPDLSYAVTPKAVENLRAFLDATGWTCLYGVNFGTNTPELAADEAAFAAKTLGAKMEYLQIGNEADRFASTIRDPKLTGKPWNADTFFDEWLTFATAIVKRVPAIRFGMPDIASNAKWFPALSARLKGHPMLAHVSCLTHHYYIGGPPSNPEMTVAKILTSDPRVAQDAALVTAAAGALSKPWRMTEGNTCFRGGKPGVSDVFAAALWSADYLLTLASLGYVGVNLHGGDAQLVANSLGGTLPGDEMVTDDPKTHPRPYYTPIAHIGTRYVAEPVSYGMRFAGQLAGATLVKVEFDPGGVNATAYAAKMPNGQMAVVAINKDASRPLPIELPGYALATTLSGPSLTAHTAEISEAGSYREVTVVKPATAVLLRATRG